MKAALAAPVSGAGAAGSGFPFSLEIPAIDYSKWGAVERKPMSRIRRVAATHLHRAWVSIPHVTQFDEADITELEAFRVQLNKEYEKQGVKVTMLAFMIKATVAALRKGRRTVWVPGALRPMFAAFRHLPGPIWRRLPLR